MLESTGCITERRIMSPVIRLENLPSSVKTADIRDFFQGCDIPSGGVVIVGGALGLAFVVLASDDDANIAMRNNGQHISNCSLKLFSSSKTELRKVINDAKETAKKNQLPVAKRINSVTNQDKLFNPQGPNTTISHSRLPTHHTIEQRDGDNQPLTISSNVRSSICPGSQSKEQPSMELQQGQKQQIKEPQLQPHSLIRDVPVHDRRTSWVPFTQIAARARETMPRYGQPKCEEIHSSVCMPQHRQYSPEQTCVDNKLGKKLTINKSVVPGGKKRWLSMEERIKQLHNEQHDGKFRIHGDLVEESSPRKKLKCNVEQQPDADKVMSQDQLGLGEEEYNKKAPNLCYTPISETLPVNPFVREHNNLLRTLSCEVLKTINSGYEMLLRNINPESHMLKEVVICKALECLSVDLSQLPKAADHDQTDQNQRENSAQRLFRNECELEFSRNPHTSGNRQPKKLSDKEFSLQFQQRMQQRLNWIHRMRKVLDNLNGQEAESPSPYAILKHMEEVRKCEQLLKGLRQQANLLMSKIGMTQPHKLQCGDHQRLGDDIKNSKSDPSCDSEAALVEDFSRLDPIDCELYSNNNISSELLQMTDSTIGAFQRQYVTTASKLLFKSNLNRLPELDIKGLDWTVHTGEPCQHLLQSSSVEPVFCSKIGNKIRKQRVQPHVEQQQQQKPLDQHGEGGMQMGDALVRKMAESHRNIVKEEPHDDKASYQMMNNLEDTSNVSHTQTIKNEKHHSHCSSNYERNQFDYSQTQEYDPGNPTFDRHLPIESVEAHKLHSNIQDYIKNETLPQRSDCDHITSGVSGNANDTNRFICIDDLPDYVEESNIRKLFSNLQISSDGIRIMQSSNISKRKAFIRFNSELDACDALKLGSWMAQAIQITVLKSSPAEFYLARNTYEEYSHLLKGKCVMICNVHPTTSEDHLDAFFDSRPFSADGGPFFEVDLQGQSTGRAMVQFERTEHFLLCFQHQDNLLLDRKIHIVAIPPEQLQGCASAIDS